MESIKLVVHARQSERRLASEMANYPLVLPVMVSLVMNKSVVLYAH